MSLLNDLAGSLGRSAGAAIVDLVKDQDLGGLVGKFEQAGLGDIASSWISTGANKSISAEQIHAALGSGPVAQVAQLGVDPAEAAKQIAAVLPVLIDRLTPEGKLPSGGAGGLGGLLGGLKL